jgi:hypothetical protein
VRTETRLSRDQTSNSSQQDCLIRFFEFTGASRIEQASRKGFAPQKLPPRPVAIAGPLISATIDFGRRALAKGSRQKEKIPGSFLPGILLDSCQTFGIRSYAERECSS